jgi:periplasmic divalent cation tolerance protein
MSALELIEVRITVPDEATAESIARGLVEARLVACAQILPQMLSVFHWRGGVDQAREHLVLAKTTARQFEAICERVGGEHPYDTPEIIAVPITHSSAAYAVWLADSVTLDFADDVVLGEDIR